MRHFIHRHEPPVPAAAIPVVGLSALAVAVCKPAGMPVHVAGQYRKNTVLGVLTAERPELGPLHPVHRRAGREAVQRLPPACCQSLSARHHRRASVLLLLLPLIRCS